MVAGRGRQSRRRKKEKEKEKEEISKKKKATLGEPNRSADTIDPCDFISVRNGGNKNVTFSSRFCSSFYLFFSLFLGGEFAFFFLASSLNGIAFGALRAFVVSFSLGLVRLP